MIIVNAFVWDEHEEPQQIPWYEDDTLLPAMLMQRLETKEYGKVVKTYPASKHVSKGELVLHYRAFDDEFRGRQIVSGTDLADLDRAYQEHKRRCAARVFTPAELYALKPTHVDYGTWHTINVHLSSDVDYFSLTGNFDAIEKQQRMETRTIVDHDYDGRRGWTLQTVWFDGKPVMVVNSSGRDGDEYHGRWITDSALFGELVAFLRSFTPEAKGDQVKASAKIPAMTEFYNHSIHDYYDVEAQEPKKA